MEQALFEMMKKIEKYNIQSREEGDGEKLFDISILEGMSDEVIGRKENLKECMAEMIVVRDRAREIETGMRFKHFPFDIVVPKISTTRRMFKGLFSSQTAKMENNIRVIEDQSFVYYYCFELRDYLNFLTKMSQHSVELNVYTEELRQMSEQIRAVSERFNRMLSRPHYWDRYFDLLDKMNSYNERLTDIYHQRKRNAEEDDDDEGIADSEKTECWESDETTPLLSKSSGDAADDKKEGEEN